MYLPSIRLFGILSILLLGFSHCTNVGEQLSDAPPNILWIIAEDLSPDLGCYGHPLVQTPNIDSLAANGTRYSEVFVTAPACTPSRTALATGMYQTSINAHHMRYPDSLKNPLPDGILPLNELLRQQGYVTANIKDKPGRGKTDWSFQPSDATRFDYHQWDSLSADRPFFGVVNLRLTHRPFEKDSINPIDPGAVRIPPYYPNHPIAQDDWAAYLESVQLMDRLVGKVMTTLEEKGLAENTIIFFFSDHGRPMPRAKNYHFDSGTKIPLVISCPENHQWNQYFPSGGKNDQLISAIDITATTLTLAGANKPNWMQGQVFAGPQKESERVFIFCASDRMGETHFKTRSIRSKQFKYIHRFRNDFSINQSATAYRKANHPIHHVLNILWEQKRLNPSQLDLVEPIPEEAFYDMKNDPLEVYNQIKNQKYQEEVDRLKKELKNWQETTHDYGMEPDSEALETHFKRYRQLSEARYEQKIIELEAQIREGIETEVQ